MPPSLTITSPERMPALAAGPFGVTGTDQSADRVGITSPQVHRDAQPGSAAGEDLKHRTEVPSTRTTPGGMTLGWDGVS